MLEIDPPTPLAYLQTFLPNIVVTTLLFYNPNYFLSKSVKISIKIHINFRTRFSKKSLKSKPFVTNFSAFKMASRLTHIEASHLKSTATEDFIAKKSRNALDYWADW